MVLGQIMRDMKDGALALSLKSFLNDRFHDYGEVLDCSVDTKAGRLELHMRMRGERDPITAAIERFELRDTDEGKVVVLHSFSTSREWITRLVTRMFKGKQYKLPGAVSALL